MAPLKYDVVDVFTDQRYSGNQLAIVHVPKGRPLGEEEKLSIAIEFGYSETVFVLERTEENQEWKINIYTIQGEIPLAGHPVIGAAWLLGARSHGHLMKGTLVPAAGATPFTLDWSSEASCEPRVTMPQTLHGHTVSISREQVLHAQPSLRVLFEDKIAPVNPVVSLVKGMTFVLVELESMAALSQVSGGSATPSNILDQDWQPSLVGWYFYYRERPNLDHDGHAQIHCRMVEDKIGEDPATGSAACTLSGHLSQEAKKKGHAGDHFKYAVMQGEHMGRKSEIKVEVSVSDTANIQSIILQGKAVHVMSGILVE